MKIPIKRREALSKYFLDVSKIVLTIGVLTPLLVPKEIKLGPLFMFLFVSLFLVMLGYRFQPKE